MKRLLLILIAMIPIIETCGTMSKAVPTTGPDGVSESESAGPKGDLIYCSFSETRHGGLGKDYCELVADPGTVPVVHVRMNIGNDLDPEDNSHKGDYNVKEKTVKDLQQKLADAKVYELNGYSLDEMLCGGATYRIYMEYSSGESVNATWFGHDVKPEAVSAYSMIREFFEPWIKKCCSH